MDQLQYSASGQHRYGKIINQAQMLPVCSTELFQIAAGKLSTLKSHPAPLLPPPKLQRLVQATQKDACCVREHTLLNGISHFYGVCMCVGTQITS